MKLGAAVWFLGVGLLAGGAVSWGKTPLDPMEVDCPACESGVVPCSVCRREKSVQRPCATCDGMGGMLCTRCTQGTKPCPSCGGAGMKTLVPMGVRRRGEAPPTRSCPPRVDCRSCSGGLIPCKQKGCIGGLVRVPCPGCNQSGQEDCLTCGGKGKIPLEPESRANVIPDPNPDAGANFEFLKASARVRVRTIEKAAKRIEELAPAGEKALARFAQLEERVTGLRSLAATETSLAQALRNLEGNWRICERTAKRGRRLIDRAAELQPLAAEHLGSLNAIDGLKGFTGDEASVRERLEKHAVYATDFRTTAEQLEMETRSLPEALERREKEINGLMAKYRARLEEKARLEREKKEMLKSFERFQAQLPAIARRCEMPAVEGELLESSKPRELHVQVEYFDTEVLVEDESDAVPTEGALGILPSFITEVFKGFPEVQRIQAVIAGTWVGETGLDELRGIQRFTMDRGRWRELTTGRYKDSWQELLTRSKPVPPYPRPSTTNWTPFLILLAVLVLGLAAIYVTRSTMFSR